jgi:hypothetical protein
MLVMAADSVTTSLGVSYAGEQQIPRCARNDKGLVGIGMKRILKDKG